MSDHQKRSRDDEQPTADGVTPTPRFDEKSVVLSFDPQGEIVQGVSLRELDAEEEAGPSLRAGSEKYQVIRLLAQGGMGRVYLAYDRDLKRRVALKTVLQRTPVMSQRFLEECQVLAQLEHPNIVALHDVGLTQNRHLYYTMRFLRGLTMREVLDGLRKGEPSITRTYSLTRLMQIFVQVAQAIHYAHDRGVVHRDLKPDNVMLGEHGEVQVLDWGLATLTRESGVETSRDFGRLTLEGAVVGTPWYMAPEQAEGLDVDHRADIYALGTILYEILTLARPFEGTSMQVMIAVVRDPPIPPRARTVERAIPIALERICLQALAKKPDDRPSSVGDILGAVQEWLEAETDKSKRHQLAEKHAAEGRETLAQYRAAKDDIRRQEDELKAERGRSKGWQPIAEKRALLTLEESIVARRKDLIRAASATVAAITAAVGFEAEHQGARACSADYHWERFLEAEAKGDFEAREMHTELVRAYHDGRYEAELRGDGSLALTSDPPGAEVWLHDLVERDLSFVAENPRCLGVTPLKPVPLAMGRYLAVLRAPGFADVRYPVYIGRGRRWSGTVKLYSAAAIGAGFVVVPGGPFRQGGGGERGGYTLAPGETEVGDFFIAEHPVTMGEYLEYLNDLAATDFEGAFARSPRQAPVGGQYLLRTPEGRLELPAVDGEGDHWDARLPVVGISWNDVEAYCAWRSQRDGRPCRLPTEVEWEKAARGVDGRIYPWGDRFDPSLCNMRESLRARTAPVTVDEFPTDVSVYGVRGLGGNVRDWTATIVVEGEAEEARVSQVSRGGNWFSPEWDSRCASRTWFPRAFVYDFFGFRLARSPQ